jgi:DNA adenine methylase
MGKLVMSKDINGNIIYNKNMKKLMAPIKYFGGKNLCFNEILKHFPKDGTYTTYMEPFAGSYGVGLKIENPPPIEIYNDLDKNVYSLYKVLSNPELFKQFKERCDFAPYNEDLRKEFKGLLKTDNLSLIDRAFYFFYVNRTSHNGIGGFSKNTYIRRNMSKSVSDFLSSIDRLPEIHNRLSKVIVTNSDGIELIKKYDDPKVMIYCDVPYEQSTRGSARYNVDMDRQGHIDFLDAVIESKSKILISGYDCDLYDKLTENGFEKIQFEVKTITGNFTPKVKIETLWRNYK